MNAELAVIGGSGLYCMEGTEPVEEIDIPTPFGLPSDLISIVEFGRLKVAFLPRHGRGHRLLPTEVPSKANIWARKSLGVQQIVSVSAVGSLRETIQPGTFVVCNQLVDRTRSRPNSYFGDGVAGHVGFAEPFCPRMRHVFEKVLTDHGHRFQRTGTLVVMEGPLFSTRAESHLYRSWDADLIGMTALPEAKLAREAEICYATIAMVTDYDCWRESEEAVDIGTVLEVMNDNTRSIQEILPEILGTIALDADCSCRHAAEHALMTDQARIPYDTKRRLNLFYGKYWRNNA